MPLSSRTRLGTYEIIGPLGAGGMGEVYRAKDLRLGRDVAVKVLPSGVASSPDRLARFEREARTVAALNHPNIVTLHSVEDEDGVRFLTMELVEGQTLSRLITPEGLPLARLLDIAIPLTDALVAAHQRGVVHRDLKPGNVMLTHDGRIKVLDFGLAKAAGATGEVTPDAETASIASVSPISAGGLVVGTAPYMSPEQIRGQVVDERSDLFAFGIVFYELATGRRPFGGATRADVRSSILRDTPEPLCSIRSDLPQHLEWLVSRCLEKDPDRRFQNALGLRDELRRVGLAPEREMLGPRPEPKARSVASIAVLPFVNRSRDDEDEYFSEGLADELLRMLTKIRGLRVAARTSSFQFRDGRESVSTIGRRLNVETLLEGTVRKSRNRVRISVRLVEAAGGSHLWSETYDRALDDIFAVQDDIAHSVVSELRATLLGEASDTRAKLAAKADVAAAGKGRGTSGEAHRLYLQGRYFVDRGSQDETAKGIRCLDEALKLDPTFALAWAELARAWMNCANGGWTDPREANMRARKAVERALTLEPDLAEAHVRLGGIQKNHEWDWKSAEASYRRALELAPGNPIVLDGAGVMSECLGRLDEGIALLRRAVEQNPLSSSSYSNLALVYRAAGKLDEAEEACRKGIELSPKRICIHAHLALVLLAQGKIDEALEEANQEIEEVYRLLALAVIHDAAVRRSESDRALDQLIERHARDWSFQIAEVYAARGDADRAFQWLEQAVANRDGGIPYLLPDPVLRCLHGDPRWDALLRKVGLAGSLFLESHAKAREADIREGRSVEQQFLPEALIGKDLSRYRIVEKLGRGAMGVVYRATDPRLERDVAIKVLPGRALADERSRRRFRREALALSKLNHPHIAGIFDFDTQDGTDFLVMEYVRGTPLTARVRNAALPEAEVLRVAGEVAQALAEAHSRGVIHRDLKPENIMLAERGEVKVLDFGLALFLEENAAAVSRSQSLTEAGHVVGTLPYLAPEVLRGETADARSDLYSLGVVTFEMATGRRPFPDDEPHELFFTILNQEPPPPRILNGRISPGLETVILRLLSKKPGDRYASAAELLQSLRAFGSSVGKEPQRSNAVGG